MTKSYAIPSYSGVMLKSLTITFLFSGLGTTVICPLVSNIAYSTSPILNILLARNLSSNSFIVNLSLRNIFHQFFLYILK